jgi:transposase-like protein
MQAPRKIRASNHRPEPGGLSRYLPDAAVLNKPFREYAIAAKIGCTPQTLRDWVRKAEVDSVVGRLACPGSILSGVGASGKPGAVQSEVPNFVAVLEYALSEDKRLSRTNAANRRHNP